MIRKKKEKFRMSSRVLKSKISSPSDDLPPVLSEDDLLGPGDIKIKPLKKSILKSSKSKEKYVEDKESSGALNDASKDYVITSRDGKKFTFDDLAAKDHQITSLTDSVSRMSKEIEKLNLTIEKLQEQVAKFQSNSSINLKGVQKIPSSKVSQPDGKKNESSADKTPFSKVPNDLAKKSVKFTDVVKRNAVKATEVIINSEETVMEIKASSWKGNELYYYIELESGIEKWIKSSDCKSIKEMVNEFHNLNPGAPNESDYSLADSIKIENKKKKNIMGKIKKNQTSKLKVDDIGFIASSLVKEVNKPKKFSKVAFGITNKRVFRGFTYTQKQATLKKIIHQFGLNQKVVRISLIGDSVLELYTISEEKDLVIARMQSNGWNLIDFKPEEIPEFNSKKDEKDQKGALINRLAYLYAGTYLINLKETILQDISEEIQQEIISRAEEIIKKRNDIKEGRVQAKLVQKSEL